jgi:hypothetical protein
MALLRHHDWCLTLLNTTINPATGLGQVIKVKWGEKGYYPTTLIHTQAQVDELNRKRDIQPWEAEAMSTCSIFDNWGAYDKLAANLQRVMTKKEE